MRNRVYKTKGENALSYSFTVPITQSMRLRVAAAATRAGRDMTAYARALLEQGLARDEQQVEGEKT